MRKTTARKGIPLSFTTSMLLLFVFHGCAGNQPKPPEAGDIPDKTPSIVNIQPRDGVYLRAGFDADPSPFVGRFLNEDVDAAEVDETKGVQTQCSKHIEPEVVEAGGTFDEYFNASQSAGASVGVDPGIVPDDALPEDVTPEGNVGGKLQRGTVVRVKYDLEKKMRGIKTEAYNECCRKHVDACSGRYLAEFWLGTGEIYQAVGTEKGVKAGADVPTKGEAEIDFKQGLAWRRSMKFDDLYFAFRTARAAIETAGCSWADQPPTSDEGAYFVGVSPPAASESKARTLAMRDARKQVIRYLGEYLKTETATESNAMEGYVDDEEIVQTAAEGVAKHVKDDRWCPAETKESPEGTLYKVKVLSYFPDDDRTTAAKKVLENLAASDRVSDEDKKTLQELKEGLESGTER